MSDKDILDIGSDFGRALLQEMKKKGASGGEMLGISAYLVSGILKYVNQMAENMEEVRKSFNECLDIFLEESKKGN